ncbi:MAG: fasciclin domain-containing protein [Cyanothece sp. SIO2G6]|nr:fasciclin domain-containing protein [Cyanothece sp. SIO2G6]
MKYNPIFCTLSTLAVWGAALVSPLPAVASDVAEPGLPQMGPSVLSTLSNTSGPIVAQAEGDVVDVAVNHGSFSTLVTLLQTLGMEEDLRGYGRFTVFAPTDAAFAALSPAVQAALLDESNRELVAQILAYHVVASGVPLYAEDITDTMVLRTLERGDIELQPDGRSVLVNGVEVIEADIEARNGVIHAIPQVLIPPSIAGQLP